MLVEEHLVVPTEWTEEQVAKAYRETNKRNTSFKFEQVNYNAVLLGSES